MDKEKQTEYSGMSAVKEEQCRILIESHQAYQEDVINGGMNYEDFISGFFGMHNGLLDGSMMDYREVCQMFWEHRPIIEHRFMSSVFCYEDAMAMLREFDHCHSFFNRSLIDIQLIPVIPKLNGNILKLLKNCANEIALFQSPVTDSDIVSILSGKSSTDYGIYNVSHFAYFMKELERRRLLIQHWQSMMAKLSRIVYHGHYVTQTALSTSVNRLGLQMRRPWIYDAIDDWFQSIPDYFSGEARIYV